MVTLIAAGVLTATDAQKRKLTYQLLPYGAPGRTNLGIVTASAGKLELPAPDGMVLNLEHQRTSPVGRSCELLELPAGLAACFDIANTKAGDDLLAEALPPMSVRTGISVEIEDPIIKDGALIGGRLYGAAACVDPAFTGAQLVASDTAPATPAQHPEHVPTEGITMTETLTPAPVALTAGAGAPLQAGAPSRPAARPTLRGVAEAFSAFTSNQITRTDLEAVLIDVPYSGNEAAMRPQWIGELWDGISYDRDIINEIAGAPLTSGSLAGWAWNPKPQGGNYSGNKDPITSSPIGMDPVSQGIQRWAGGHDFDRIWVDLGQADVMESYFRTMADDYAEWSNAACTFDLMTAAGAPIENADPLALLISVATSIKGGPTFIALGTAVAAALMGTDASLPFLTGQLLLSGRGSVGGSGLFIGQELAPDTILAGRREAATYFEPGGVPLKVRAVDIAKAGEDAALFGYCATLVRRPAAFKAGTTIVTP
jgi:hypothetical protein